MSSSTDVPSRPSSLFDDFSVEITGHDTGELQGAAHHLPPATRVNVTFLGNEEATARVDAVDTVRALGLRPVPHLSARRLRSQEELGAHLTAWSATGPLEEVVVIGGDPAVAAGPFNDSLALIVGGMLGAHGVRRVHVAGYPEGHPKIEDEVLWKVVQEKLDLLEQQGLAGSIATQFVFDTEAVTSWLEQLRGRGITAPVRVGVPGPAGVQRLLRYARRFGVGSSAGVVAKYGFSLTGLLGTAGPDRFLADLAAQLDQQVHGDVALHFYTFGGVRATAEWIREKGVRR